ncbi:MAG: hypothetical protein II393_02315 [Cytophagales bacterium]|nr:hypothetical protein [Cytophagales bacterium]
MTDYNEQLKQWANSPAGQLKANDINNLLYRAQSDIRVRDLLNQILAQNGGVLIPNSGAGQHIPSDQIVQSNMNKNPTKYTLEDKLQDIIPNNTNFWGGLMDGAKNWMVPGMGTDSAIENGRAYGKIGGNYYGVQR